MSALTKISFYLRTFFKRRKVENEMHEEMGIHLKMETEAKLATGMSPQEAIDATQREFGNIALFEEASREVWAWPIIDSAAADLKYALSQIKRSPGLHLQ